MRTLILAAVMVALSWPVQAQQCGTRTEAAASLQSMYGEMPVARGITQSGAMLEVFATADGATWTLIVSTPDGRACAAGAGTAWQVVTPPPADKGA